MGFFSCGLVGRRRTFQATVLCSVRRRSSSRARNGTAVRQEVLANIDAHLHIVYEVFVDVTAFTPSLLSVNLPPPPPPSPCGLPPSLVPPRTQMRRRGGTRGPHDAGVLLGSDDVGVKRARTSGTFFAIGVGRGSLGRTLQGIVPTCSWCHGVYSTVRSTVGFKIRSQRWQRSYVAT